MIEIYGTLNIPVVKMLIFIYVTHLKQYKNPDQVKILKEKLR